MPKFETYAQYYDQIYHDKDYAGEAAYVSSLLKEYFGCAPSEIRMIDLACGTGRHLAEFGRAGFQIAGSDASAPMVSVAKTRLGQAGFSPELFTEPFQTCDRVNSKYDAALALFSSIDYLTKSEDLLSLLSNIKRIVRPGGVFLFDFWNGHAVQRDYSPVRVRDVEKAGRRIIRNSETKLDLLAQIADVTMKFIVLEQGQLAEEFTELHRMRYYFPAEMRLILEAQGLELIRACPFGEPSQAIGSHDWNLTYLARVPEISKA